MAGCENCEFKDEWTEKYVCVLSGEEHDQIAYFAMAIVERGKMPLQHQAYNTSVPALLR